jgi:hypothetical protein
LLQLRRPFVQIEKDRIRQGEKYRGTQPGTYRVATLKGTKTAAQASTTSRPHRGGGIPIGTINKNADRKHEYTSVPQRPPMTTKALANRKARWKSMTDKHR